MNLPSLKIGKYAVKHPIVQGGMAVRLSQNSLAAAVANEGGIGIIAASGIPIDEVVSEVREARSKTDGVIGINIMVASKICMEVAEAAAQNGINIIFCGAGFSKDIFKLAGKYNIEVVPIVSSLRLALVSEKLGVKAIVVESGEAGGHLGTEDKLDKLLPEIVKRVNVPVIAGGGIITVNDAARVFRAGAAAIQMGSRFAATNESSAPDELKKIYVECREEDIILIESPLGLTGRAIKNKFIDDIMEGKTPTFDRMKCDLCMKYCRKNYCILDSLDRVQRGEVESGILFAGEKMHQIKEILSVKQVFDMFVNGLAALPE